VEGVQVSKNVDPSAPVKTCGFQEPQVEPVKVTPRKLVLRRGALLEIEGFELSDLLALRRLLLILLLELLFEQFVNCGNWRRRFGICLLRILLLKSFSKLLFKGHNSFSALFQGLVESEERLESLLV